MEQIDELFGQFIRKQEILGRAETTIRGYKHSFNYFRKLMPYVSADNINDEKVLEFDDKLRKVIVWNPDINEFVPLKPSTVLNFIICLWSFLIWLKKHQNDVFDILNIEKFRSEITINKSLFFQIYSKKRNLLFKNHIEHISCNNFQFNIIDTELLNKQLNRRYNSFLHFNNAVYFRGIADYVKFIIEKKHLYNLVNTYFITNEIIDFLQSYEDSIHDSEQFEEIYQNSEWGSWFNLELVYMLIFKIRELISEFSDEKDIVDYINKLCCELRQILMNNLHSEPSYFKRDDYDGDILRIHHCLIELLENEQFKECPDIRTEERILYKFNELGMPRGELYIKGFEPFEFTRKPALVLQFYYLNRCDNEYYSYHDFNEYLGPGKKHVLSNDFRLLIDSINRRVKSNTAGVIKKIIVKRSFDCQIKKTNCYRFIEV